MLSWHDSPALLSGGWWTLLELQQDVPHPGHVLGVTGSLQMIYTLSSSCCASPPPGYLSTEVTMLGHPLPLLPGGNSVHLKVNMTLLPRRHVVKFGKCVAVSPISSAFSELLEF